MGKRLKETGYEIKERWIHKMPRFFYWIVVAISCIISTAFTLNSVVPAMGGMLPEWWPEIYSHILTCGICVILACKFTVAGGYKDIDPDGISKGNIVLDKDIDHMEAEKPEI